MATRFLSVFLPLSLSNSQNKPIIKRAYFDTPALDETVGRYSNVSLWSWIHANMPMTGRFSTLGSGGLIARLPNNTGPYWSCLWHRL